MGTTCSANGQRQTDSLPLLIMKYQPRGKRSQGPTLKRLLDCYRDQNRSPCKIYNDDKSGPNPSAPIFQIQQPTFLARGKPNFYASITKKKA